MEFTELCFPEPNTGCWFWTGQIDIANGYGRFLVDGAYKMAHRHSYEMHKGKIKDGLVIDHLCRNTLCVNPEHLEPVSVKENVLRGIGITAENKRKTHCPSGHEYTSENTRISKSGKRACRACDRIRWHKNKEKKQNAIK